MTQNKNELFDKLSEEEYNILNDAEKEAFETITRLEEPAPDKFGCFIIGNSGLPIQCGEIILNHGHKIFAMMSSDSHVEKWAREKDIPFLFLRTNKKGVPFVKGLRKKLVVAFLKSRPFHYFFSISNPMIIDAKMLSFPIKGAINYHNSYLPGYAGVNSTNWAVYNNEKRHGITWHFVDEGTDTGDIIKQIEIPIDHPQETGISLNIKCSDACIKAFEELIGQLKDGQKDNLPRVRQVETEENRRSLYLLNQRPPAAGILSFNLDAETISARVRGLNFEMYENPNGTPKIKLGGDFFIVLHTEITSKDSDKAPGTVVKIKPGSLVVSTATKDIEIDKIMEIHGAEISIPDFVKKCGIQENDYFDEIGEALADRITKIDNEKVRKYETFWSERLRVLQPVELANTIFKELIDTKGEVFRETCPIPSGFDKIEIKTKNEKKINRSALLFASFGAFLTRITSSTYFHIGYAGISLKFGAKGLGGLFADQVPVPVNVESGETFSDLCKAGHRDLKLANKNNTYIRDIRVRYPILHSSSEPGIPVNVLVVKTLDEVAAAGHHPGPLTFVIPEEGDRCAFYYNKAVTRDTEEKPIDRFIIYFRRALDSVVEDVDLDVSHIEIMPEEEKKKVLFDFNDNASDYPRDKTLQEIFEEQVEKYPENMAVIGNSYAVSPNDEPLTYARLNAKANQLARLLRQKGIQTDVPAAIMVEPSQEMMVGLMGILKAGGAFLPVKDGTPAERVKYILNESGARFMLTRRELLEEVSFGGDVVFLDDAGLYSGDETNPELITKPRDLAYIIYTSGSTGKPKGVMIEHRGLLNLCYWHNNYYEVTSEDRATKYAGFAFDASVWEIFPYFVAAAALYIVPEDIKLDVEALTDYFSVNKITIGFLPTQVCEQFMNTENKSLRVMLVGGDKLRTFIKRDYKLYNNYGPTENTVVTTAFHVEEITGNIPIGKPLYNNQIYIVDKNDNPQPIGIAGELLVGGDSLARGYVNKPEMTLEKFPGLLPSIPDAGRIYRTGDLSRWLPDGNIEFLGRIDFQVKIRGYRIELGEIENQLLALDEIKETVVIAREDTPGKKYLCAYVVSDQKVDFESVKSEIGKNLTDYMIPSGFMQIDRFPLTPNGKIDTRALPAPETKGAEEYEAPSNETEEMLVAIWTEILGVEKIGINDDFFSLGGDSIKAIQIISRVQKNRFRLEVSQLFLHKNIKMVARHLKAVDEGEIRETDQGPVEGNVMLTPIQKWFFEHHSHDGRHFNHAVTLFREERYNEESIKKTFDKILEHHDALRMAFKFHGSVVVQENRGIDDTLYDLEVIDAEEETDEAAFVKKESFRIQSSVDWENGPLVKLGLFKGAQGDHLLFAVHHAVIDGISWRVLLDDFESGYQAAETGDEIVFQEKTDSFKYWAQRLVEYSRSAELLKEVPYWKFVESVKIEPLPVDHEIGKKERKFKHSVVVPMVLSREKTDQLMTEVNRVYRTEINDVLLTAVGLAFRKWTGKDNILINMEGHGREEVIRDANISRTVGWFTIQYPLVLDMSKGDDVSYSIKNVKETMRGVPYKGFGHGVLKYLTPEDKKEAIHFRQQPEIVFNYLGEFAADHYTMFDSITGITDLNIEDAINPDFEIGHKIDIEGVLDDGCLKLLFFYNELEYERETIEKLSEILKYKLEKVIDHCRLKKESEATPSDLGYKKISIGELERVSGQIKELVAEDAKIESLFPLSPMQIGMFYHSLKDTGSHAYFEQIVLKLEGEIDNDLMEESLNKIVDRYDILRTVFIYEGLEEPLQAVLEKRFSPLQYLDISDLDEEQQDAYFIDFLKKDQQDRFDLFKGPLSRFVLIKAGNSAYRLYWSFHHILMDGWCIGIIREELREIYLSAKTKQPLELDAVEPYKNYIDWLGKQDKDEGLRFWGKFVENYSEAAGLPKPLRAVKDELYIKKEFSFDIEEEIMSGLNGLVNKYQVTLNTFFQVVWGIMLKKYNGINDVIFGTIVSGRPLEIERVDRMVGLFINMIPVRVTSTGKESFAQLMADTQTRSVSSRKYEFIPVAEIQSRSELKEGLINHLLVFENYPVQKPGKEYAYTEIGIEIHEQTNYDFNILVMPWDRLYVNFSYNSLVFENEIIENMAAHFETVVRQVLENPDLSIEEITLIPADEKEKLLVEFNRVSDGVPTGNTIHGLFESAVEKNPCDTALVHGGFSLTYRELNQSSNQLAGELRNRGVAPGQLAGVLVDRSLKMPIAILGILKAGGACFLLPPDESDEHKRNLLENSKCKLLLSQDEYLDSIEFDGDILNLDNDSLFQGNTGNLSPVSVPGDLAWIHYNPGPLEELNGVMLTHSVIANALSAIGIKYPITGGDAYLMRTPVQYWTSIVELLGWFFGGGRLVITGYDSTKNTRELADIISGSRVTHVHLAPTLFNQLLNVITKDNKDKISCLKYVFLSGEPVLPETLARFEKLDSDIKVEHIYGLPETSFFNASLSLFDWKGTGIVPVGKPVDSINLYVLNFDNGKPSLLPVGVPGEIAVAGPCLAAGYYHNEALTGTNFIENPFLKDGADSSYKKLFRTGEMGRWLADGNLEWMGPADLQVKIRGTWIQRSEIENALLTQPGIKETVVVAREDSAGFYLCAYFTSDSELDTSELRERLSDCLPSIMIPSYIIQLEEIPLTPEGRADRSELLDIKHDPHQIEDILAEIEAEVLNIDRDDIELDDNFFALGGQSLKASKVVSKIHKAFNVKVSMGELFKRPTLRQLSEFLTEAIQEKYSAIEPAEPKDYYPQSSAQKRLYFLHQLEEESTVYNIQMIDIYCKGFEKDKLEESFKKLIKRHESLRTSFHLVDGKPVQKIHDYEEVGADFEIEYYETDESGRISTWDPGNKQEGAQSEGVFFEDVIKGFVKPFDLGTPPLLRVGFIKIWGNTKILMLDMHHIVADGISLEILAKELWELYDGEELEPLRLQYKDFSEWLNSENQVSAVTEQEAFWLKEFAGEIPLINLPTDYPRPTKLTFEGDIFQFEIGKEKVDKLNSIAKTHAESLYMVLFSAFYVLMAKISGQDDIIAGTVTAGRGHADLENIVGMFLNTLALRNFPEGEKTFADFLTEVKLSTFAAFEHQDYPFDQLVSKVASRQEAGRNPLFDVAFGLENEADPTGYLMEVAVPDKAKPYDISPKKAKFDMTMVCVEIETGLDCAIEYKTNLFKAEAIARMAGYFEKIIDAVCTDIGHKIGAIEIISQEEVEEIIYTFNDTAKDYPRDFAIHQFFEERVEQTPGNVALKFKDKKLTYREVNIKANQLARLLREKGVGPEKLVGIMVERSFEMLIGIFGILKAGGAYLPIDPNYPEDRVRYLFKDSSAKLLLTQAKHIEFAGTVEFDGEIINLDDDSIYQGDYQNPENVNAPGDLAYIIYTSGSTGKPKGVTIEHVCAVNLLFTLDRMYPLEEKDAYLLKTAFLFDVSVSEIFGWFWRGGKMVILEQGGEKDPLMMIDVIDAEKITHLNFVPSMFNVFVSMLDESNIDKLAGLRYIFLAGEAIWPDSVLKFRELNSNTIIENLYGPTEATVYASWYPVAHWKGTGSVSIGKPVDNLKLYIISSDDKVQPALQPVGIAGELAISGIQLARGYLNRPELTAQMFADNPMASYEKGDKNFEKLYHTGDLCRWFPDGNIEYMGRIDFQVKVRGFRIELGEIENQLMKIEKIDEAIVIVREDKEGEKYLCAYLMSAGPIDVPFLRKSLGEELPEYMVPSYFVQIEKIPLNPNGKLDRKALPEPEAEVSTREYIAPTNEIEEALVEIWSEILGMEKISIDDNFFEIGGDSIKTILISGRLLKRGLRVNVNEFFTNKTIRELAGQVKKIEREISQAPVSGDVKMTPILHWYFEKEFPEKECFIHFTNHEIDPSLHDLYGNRFDVECLKKVLKKLVEHHDALRIVFPSVNGGFAPRNRKVDEGSGFDLEVVDFEEKSRKECEEEYQEHILRVDKSINLDDGPLVKLILFRYSDGDSLRIVVHHAVIDGISWRILIEDLEAGYKKALNGEEIKFQDKTDSFLDWADRLSQYADSQAALSEFDYWKKIEEIAIEPLPRDFKVDDKTRISKNYNLAEEESLFITLDKNDTLNLLTQVNLPYATEINDILLTALAMAVKEWCCKEKILINLEGHGRENIIEDFDFSRTMGWFTSIYPVLLDLQVKPYSAPGEDNTGLYIKKVKEGLRRIPNKGVGYGILKYLSAQGNKEGARFDQQPDISFNYLGQLSKADESGASKNIFNSTIADRTSDLFNRDCAIDVFGYVGASEQSNDEELKLFFAYNKKEFERKSIEIFASLYRDNLKKVIEHCMEKKNEIVKKGVSALDYHIQIDYDRYLERLEKEEWEDLTEENNYMNILLTGSTGFLGSHMLFELINKTNATLYLPVRGANEDAAEQRFIDKMTFYFGEEFYARYKDRLNVICADLGADGLGLAREPFNKLADTLDAIVHPAADVRHHASYDELYRNNVKGTEELLKLAITGKKSDFHYVSTLSVAFGNIPGRDYVVYTEYNHDAGQQIDHVYIRSKFEAEKIVLAYHEQYSLNASIYRVGNLIFHTETGKFQENIEDDYFYAIMKGAVKLKMLTGDMKKMVFDMSFINNTAESVVLLLTRKNLVNETYHLVNPNELPMTDMVGFLKEIDIELNNLNDDEMDNYLAQFEGNQEYEKIIERLKFHAGLFEEAGGTKTVYKIDRTIMLLKKLGFDWTKTNRQHIEKMIAYCKEVGFL